MRRRERWRRKHYDDMRASPQRTHGVRGGTPSLSLLLFADTLKRLICPDCYEATKSHCQAPIRAGGFNRVQYRKACTLFCSLVETDVTEARTSFCKVCGGRQHFFEDEVPCDGLDLHGDVMYLLVL